MLLVVLRGAHEPVAGRVSHQPGTLDKPAKHTDLASELVLGEDRVVKKRQDLLVRGGALVPPARGERWCCFREQVAVLAEYTPSVTVFARRLDQCYAYSSNVVFTRRLEQCNYISWWSSHTRGEHWCCELRLWEM